MASTSAPDHIETYAVVPPTSFGSNATANVSAWPRLTEPSICPYVADPAPTSNTRTRLSLTELTTALVPSGEIAIPDAYQVALPSSGAGRVSERVSSFAIVAAAWSNVSAWMLPLSVVTRMRSGARNAMPLLSVEGLL